ncbi:MAG: LapA family protein [Thermodesulfobacteriota bacterium]|nr:LapA family protein [Thermodesulfobacteriota bacterium]
MKPKNIIILVLITLVVVFLLQNTQVVEVRVFFWKLSMSRIILLFGTLLIGLIAGWVLKTLTSKRPR